MKRGSRARGSTFVCGFAELLDDSLPLWCGSVNDDEVTLRAGDPDYSLSVWMVRSERGETVVAAFDQASEYRSRS